MMGSLSENANEPRNSVVLRRLEGYWGMCEHLICCGQVGKCEIQRVPGSDGFFLFLCSRGLIDENPK